MRPPEAFETKRLHLRKPHPRDAFAIFAGYATDDQVTRYLLWSPHASPDDTRTFLAQCEARWESGEEFTWVIEPADQPAAIGMIACRPTGPAVDFGYVLARPYWGKQIMVEALGEVARWWLEQDGITRLTATCHPDNLRSARVLEKVGMKRQRRLGDHHVYPALGPERGDAVCYALVKDTGVAP